MSKFNVGDRVVVINDDNNEAYFRIGAEGIVKPYLEGSWPGWLLVTFDKGDFTPCQDNSWFVQTNRVELVKVLTGQALAETLVAGDHFVDKYGWIAKFHSLNPGAVFPIEGEVVVPGRGIYADAAGERGLWLYKEVVARAEAPATAPAVTTTLAVVKADNVVPSPAKSTVVKLTPQAQEVLKLLRSKGSLTAVEAAAVLRVRSLSRRITELRAAGEPIVAKHKRDITGQRYVRYFLDVAKETRASLAVMSA